MRCDGCGSTDIQHNGGDGTATCMTCEKLLEADAVVVSAGSQKRAPPPKSRTPPPPLERKMGGSLSPPKDAHGQPLETEPGMASLGKRKAANPLQKKQEQEAAAEKPQLLQSKEPPAAAAEEEEDEEDEEEPEQPPKVPAAPKPAQPDASGPRMAFSVHGFDKAGLNGTYEEQDLPAGDVGWRSGLEKAEDAGWSGMVLRAEEEERDGVAVWGARAGATGWMMVEVALFEKPGVDLFSGQEPDVTLTVTYRNDKAHLANMVACTGSDGEDLPVERVTFTPHRVQPASPPQPAAPRADQAAVPTTSLAVPVQKKRTTAKAIPIGAEIPPGKVIVQRSSTNPKAKMTYVHEESLPPGALSRMPNLFSEECGSLFTHSNWMCVYDADAEGSTRPDWFFLAPGSDAAIWPLEKTEDDGFELEYKGAALDAEGRLMFDTYEAAIWDEQQREQADADEGSSSSSEDESIDLDEHLERMERQPAASVAVHGLSGTPRAGKGRSGKGKGRSGKGKGKGKGAAAQAAPEATQAAAKAKPAGYSPYYLLAFATGKHARPSALPFATAI